MQKILLTLILCASGSVVLPAFAGAPKGCSKAVERLNAGVKNGKGFASLYSFYQKHRACDEGRVAAAISRAVARSLEGEWRALPAFSKKLKNDGFREFLFSHIEALESSSTKELKGVQAKAKRNCPKGQEDLCMEISLAADSALEMAAEAEAEAKQKKLKKAKP